MILSEFKSLLEAHAAHGLRLILPDGRAVPAHFHVTEVGHIAKRFVDCGGTFRSAENCRLQTYVGSARDDGHRLTAGKLAHILGLAHPILSGNPPVEFEYEDRVVSQYPLVAAEAEDGVLVLQLGNTHTDCLAKDRCGIETVSEGGSAPAEAADCCGGAAPGRCC